MPRVQMQLRRRTSLDGGPVPEPKRLFSTLAASLVLWSLVWGRTPAAAPEADAGAEREEDVEPAPVARLRGHLGWGACASFSRDGRKILTAGHHSAWLWDGSTYRRLTPPLAHAGVIYTAKFSRHKSEAGQKLMALS